MSKRPFAHVGADSKNICLSLRRTLIVVGVASAWTGCSSVECPDGLLEVAGEARCVSRGEPAGPSTDGDDSSGSVVAIDGLGRSGWEETVACDESCASDCVNGICNDPVQVAAGGGHTCVRFRAGTVRCWGYNAFGQLGYGHRDTIGDDESPASEGDVDLGGAAIQIATGDEHTCAVLEGGTLRCWGYNRFGQLGYGNINDVGDDETPAMVDTVDVGGVVTEVSAGSSHTCAKLEGGKVRCWGNPDNGRLGYGNTRAVGAEELPSAAGDINLGRRAVGIQAADGRFALAFGGIVPGSISCAVLEGGGVRCWGPSSAPLGYPRRRTDLGDNETPADVGVVDIGGPVTQIAAGVLHVCALLGGDAVSGAGPVRCWGENAAGILGYGMDPLIIGDDEHPAEAGDVPIGGNATQIALSGMHTCALLDTGNVRCWGIGDILGYESNDIIGDDEVPSSVGVVNLGGRALQISAGTQHTCALLEGGRVRCWGGNEHSQLGTPDSGVVGDEVGEMPPPDIMLR